MVAALLAAADVRSEAGQVPDGFQDQPVVAGLRRPIAMAGLPDGRVLFAEQLTARIRLVVGGGLASIDPVGTVPDVRTTGQEQGLLGITVDPQWPARPYLYVHHDDALAPNIRIARFTLAGDLDYTGDGSLTLDPATRRDILTDIPDNHPVHNGGTVRFGPDGMLYVSVGEDADPCAAQDTISLRGVILRLDVSGLPPGPGGPPAKSAITPAANPFATHPDPNARLVWALGLRNPFRFSIDVGGELFIGDVGQDSWEEISRAPAGGIDLGWPLFEGPAPFASCPGAAGAGMTAPIYSYPHVAPYSHSVVAGPVYRYPVCSTPFHAFPADYVGDLFVGDYFRGFLRRLKGAGSSWAPGPPVPGQPSPEDWGIGFLEVSDWMVSCDGALWYCRQSFNFLDDTGEIRRIVHATSTGVPREPPRVDFRPPWPSPAREKVHFDFSLPAAAPVELAIYDGRGRLIRRVVPGRLETGGSHREVWDGRDGEGRAVSPGLYFARLKFGGHAFVRRIALL